MNPKETDTNTKIKDSVPLNEGIRSPGTGNQTPSSNYNPNNNPPSPESPRGGKK